MIILCVGIGILAVAVTLAPFWVGPGGVLAESFSNRSPSYLRSLQDEILKRYLEEEKAFADENLSKFEWEKRKSFLVNRYIDTSRRLDFLMAIQKGQESS